MDQKSRYEKLKTRVRIRLWIDQAFIDVYYNAEDEITSYAYIEAGRRTFGANNMRMGWHLYPFERIEEHKPIKSLSIGRFLQMLENELKKRRKI